jgi:hypothetical protein
MSMLYAVINKETKIIENMIVWDGIDTNLVPENQEWINILENKNVGIGWSYIDGQFIDPNPIIES